MSKIEFKKDLAGKWRTCKIEIQWHAIRTN
jgi:hypothetical protein